MNVKVFKNQDLIFTPCKVDVEFWKEFVNIYFSVLDIETLYNIYKTNPEEFINKLEPLARFISTTEKDLLDMGYIEEQTIQDQVELN